MDRFDEFLRGLLREGRVRFESQPATTQANDTLALGVLRSAFDVARREVAGPVIGFHPGVALAAADFVRQAAWAVLCRGEDPDALSARLPRPVVPRSPSEHLSADLTLRYLPAIEARAQAIDPDDFLLDRINQWFRACPLSGVLSSLIEGPDTPLDLGEHPGLAFLYAERLARHDRPGWRPAGAARAYADWIVGVSESRTADLSALEAGAWADE